MAKSDLEYVIAVELAQLKDLQQLHDTIRAIQELSTQGAEFDVRVRTDSLTGIADQVAKAVAVGVDTAPSKRRDAPAGGGRGGGDPTASGSSGGSSSLEREVRALVGALRSMAGNGQDLGGPRERAVQSSDPRTIAAQAALDETKKTIRAVERLVERGEPIGAVGREVITRQLPVSFRRKVKDLEAARESVSPEFFAEQESRLFDPNRIVQELAKRAARQMSTLTKVQTSSRTTAGGAELTMAVDARALTLAFETGAKQLGEALRAGIVDAMAGLQFQPNAAGDGVARPGIGFSPRPVTRAEALQASTTLRPSGTGSTLLVREQQRVRLLDERDAERRRLAVLREEQEDLAFRTGATGTGKSIAFAAPGELASKKDILALEQLQARFRQIPGELKAAEANLRVLDKSIEQSVRDIEGLRVRGEGGSAFLSRRQRDSAVAGFDRDPQGIGSLANRRAARAAGLLSDRESELVQLATQSGVVGTPGLLSSFTSRRVTQSGEVKEISDTVAALSRGLSAANDNLRTEKDPVQRGALERTAQGLASDLNDAEAARQGATFSAVNKLITNSSGQLQAELTRKLAQDEISPDQFRNRSGALRASTARLENLVASNPGIERELVLFPQEFAAFVKRTVEQYVSALKAFATKGVALPQELLQDIARNDLLKGVVGNTPKTPKEAERKAEALIGFSREFTSAKTLFEQTRGRGVADIPDFSPDLSIATTPFGPSGAFAEQSIRPERSLEDRKRILDTFLASGGTFAPATRDRLEESALLLRAKQGQFDKEPSEFLEQRITELQRELEFGGKFVPAGLGREDRTVVDGVLLGRAERSRVVDGGVRSEVVGVPLEGAGGSVGLPPGLQATAEFEKVLAKVENSLSRVLKTLESLSKVGFDPMIAAFTKMQETLAPLAATFEKFQRVAVGTGAKATERAASLQFAADREKAVQEQREIGAINRALTKGDLPGTARVAAVVEPFVALGADTQLPALAIDPASQAKLLAEDFRQLQRLSIKRSEAARLEQSLIATGLPVESLQAKTAREAAQFGGTLGSFAERASLVASTNPRFFGGDTPQVQDSASAVLALLDKRASVGADLTALQQLGARQAVAEGALDQVANQPPTENVALQAARTAKQTALQAELNKVLTETAAIFARLRATGTLSPKDAATVETLTKKHSALNAELNKQGELLLKSSQAAIQAEKSGGGFLSRVQTRLQSLSAFVFAGGIVFTLAQQLKQAGAEALGLESDLKQIQGVLSSRSSGEASSIGRGVVAAASDFGVPLRQAVQSSKFFAQTGASSTETVELTRASLAAQTGADLEAKQATEFLIAVENITKGRVRPFEILDRVAAIEAQFAVSASDLSIAIQRSGSIAAQLQPQALGAVDALDLIIGSATTIIERTRVSGNQAATGLRFVISRLSSPEVARTLQEDFGVKLAGDNPGTLRPLQDILGDIAQKFNDLNASGDTVRAQQLLVSFSGARQINLGAALLEGFSGALETAKASSLSFGDTQDRVRLRLESTSARLTQFGTAFAAFASSLLTDTGIGGALRAGVGAATSVLRGAVGNPGLPVVAGGLALSGAGLVARNLQQLLTVAPGATAGGLAPGLGRTASAFARGLGASVLGGLASFASGAAIFAAAVGTLQLIVLGFQRAADRRRVRTAEPFDQELFRQSPFFQEFEQQALGFGRTPEELAGTVQSAADQVLESATADLAAGKIPRDQVFNEANKRLVEFFDLALPGFAALGTEAERIAEAAGLLKNVAKFELAVPNSFLSEARTDLADIVAEFRQNSVDLGGALRQSQTGFGLAGGTFVATKSTVGSRDGSGLIAALNKAFSFRGENAVDFGQLSLGGQSIEQIVKAAQAAGRSPLASLDTIARQQLLLSQSDLETFSKADQRTNFVVKDRDAERLRLILEDRKIKDVDDPRRASLSETNQRFANLDRAAESLVSQLSATIGLPTRVQQLANETGAIGSEEGSAFAQAIKQTLDLAVRKLDEQLKRELLQGQDTSGTRKLLNTLNDPKGRRAQDADLALQTQAARAGVRDRLFAPILGFAERSARNRVQSDLQDRFGITFDESRARSDNAQQLLQDLGTLPVTLRRDLITAQASFVASRGVGTGGVGGLAAQSSDDELAAGVGTAALISTTLESTVGASKDDRTALQRITLLRKQVELAETEGLGAFIETAIGSDNKNLSEVAVGLKSSLKELAELGDGVDEATVTKLLGTLGGLGELLKAATGIVEKDIKPELARQAAIRDVARRLEQVQGANQRRNTLIGALDQSALAVAQTDPRRPEAGVALQLAQIEQAAERRRALSDEVAREETNKLALAFQKDKSIDRVEGQRDIDAREEQEKRNATADAASQSLTALSGLNAQLQRRPREEAAQLVQELVQPLRTFLSSARNFSGGGVRQLTEGVAQAAQSRLTDVFLRNVFSETGLLGDTLTTAFQAGAISTETAIEEGFRKGVERLVAAAEARVLGVQNSEPVPETPEQRLATGLALTGVSAALGIPRLPGTALIAGTVPDTPKPSTAALAASAELATGLALTGVSAALGVPLLQGAAGAAGPKKQFNFASKGRFGRAADVALPLAGTLIGGAIGGKDSFGQEGASIGALAGGAAFGPVGAFAGGVLGGAIGGLFGKKKAPEVEPQLVALERIERNTREQIEAVENQTQQLTLGSRFLNVPAGFVVPGFQPFGAGGTSGDAGNARPIEINVFAGPGQSETVIADKVASALRDQLGGRGTSFDVRSA